MEQFAFQHFNVWNIICNGKIKTEKRKKQNDFKNSNENS